MKDYIGQALVTCSPSFYSEKVGSDLVMDLLEEISNAALDLDKIKKALFYGKDDGGFLANLSRGNCDPILSCFKSAGLTREQGIQLLHGVIGIVTEAGELCEALATAHDETNPVDLVNIKEELGDIMWYMAIMMQVLQTTFTEVQTRNIEKLRARYGEKFSEYDANNRDLTTERQVLEK